MLLLAVGVGVRAAAVDGVIEIDQARAEAGGINGSLVDDPPGFPVEITQTGSYRLTGTLLIPADASAIRIEAAGVAIDLNGFGIAGPASCGGTPVTSCTPASGPPGISVASSDTSSVVVRNGFVRGVAGIGVHLGQESRLERVTLEANALTGAVLDSDSEVTDCIAHRNGADGFLVIAGAMRRVVSVANGQSGISMNGTSESLLIDSVVAGNAAFGILGLGGRVEGLVAAANAGDGVFGTSLLMESVVRGNGSQGVAEGTYGRSVIAGNGGAGGQTRNAEAIACSLVAGALICPP